MIDYDIDLRKEVLTFTVPARIHAPVTALDRLHPDLWWVECSGCPWLGDSSWSEVDALSKFREHKHDLSVEAVRATGAGKMDAAKALQASAGDIEGAIRWLEEKRRAY